MISIYTCIFVPVGDCKIMKFYLIFKDLAEIVKQLKLQVEAQEKRIKALEEKVA